MPTATPPADATQRLLLATATVALALADGTPATATVKRLTIRQLYTFARHLGAMEGPELVALCTGHPPEWCDTLTPASYADLHKACLELNFTNAAKIAEGDPRMAAQVLPFLQDARLVAILGGAAETTLAQTASLGTTGHPSSPAPAPSASAEAIGNASST